MKTVKVINVDGNRFVVPEGMPTKELQALIGFLALFQKVGQEYDYSTSEYRSYASSGISIQLEDLDLEDKATVKAECAAIYKKWKADKLAAEAAS